jgi:hypothetical protein
MADVAGGVMPGEAVSDVSGPNASLQYGDASKMQQLANSVKNSAPGAYAATQEPGGPQGQQPQPGGGGPPGGAQAQQPPVQPPPGHDIMTPDKVNNQVFTPPQQVSYPYAQGWQVAAAHPRAGPYTHLMATLTKKGAKPNGPATPGQ